MVRKMFTQGDEWTGQAVISFHKEFPKDFIVGVRIPTGANRGEVVAHVSGGQVRQGHMDQIKAEVGGVKGVHRGCLWGLGRGLVWEGRGGSRGGRRKVDRLIDRRM